MFREDVNDEYHACAGVCIQQATAENFNEMKLCLKQLSNTKRVHERMMQNNNM